jgi:acyl carrier protein
MGWRSYLSRHSDKGVSGDKREDGNRNAQQVDRAATPVRREEIELALRAHLETVYRSHRKVADTADLDPQLDLYEAGYLDSLSASEFLALAEKQYGITLPDWLIGGSANSLAALAAYIEDKLACEKS